MFTYVFDILMHFVCTNNLFNFSYAPTSDFKAPNTLDAEERDKYIDNVLEGKSVEVQPV